MEQDKSELPNRNASFTKIVEEGFLHRDGIPIELKVRMMKVALPVAVQSFPR